MIGIRTGIGIGGIVGKGTHVNLSAEYKTVLAAMPTKPNAIDQKNQNAIVKGMVDLGVFSKAVFLDMLSTHSSDSANINWKTPGTFNPSPVNSPAFEAYGGFTASTTGTKYLKSNFIPSEHADLIQKNNMCWIVGIGNEITEGFYDFGAANGANQISLFSRRSSGPWATYYLNGATGNNVVSDSSKGYFSASRNNTSNFKRNKNTGLLESYVTDDNSALPLLDKELYIGGRNNGGTPDIGNHQIRFAFLFSYLTQFEINSIVKLMETYFRKYGKGLISSPISYEITPSKIAIPLVTEVGSEAGSGIHPSVLDLGAQWNGYRYWMANTPMPQAYEYPAIYGSNDGVSFEVPSGLTNPILVRTGCQNFAPDVNLFFENGTLYCFFLWNKTNVSYLKTTDGIHWGNKIDTNLVPGDPASIKAPAIIKIGSDYFMYFQNEVAASYQRYKASSIEGIWSNVETLTITGGIAVGHCDIVKIGNYYWLNWGADQSIKTAYSLDGLNFTSPSPAGTVQKNAVFEMAGFYKSSMIVSDGKNYIYYSAIPTAGGLYKTNKCEVEILTP